MKNIFLTTALVVLSAPAFASGTINVGDGGTGHYNDASINKGDTDNSLTNGDHLNNTYAPDSATSDASASVGDIITQGGSGTGGNADATGNLSNNHNQSSANNSLSNQQFGNSSAHTGNNTNDIGIGNSNHMGDQSFAGSNQMGDQTNQNSNAVHAEGGAGGSVTGSGNSANKNQNAQGQGQQQLATGGKASQGQAQSNANRVSNNIDASTRVKHAASTAYAPALGGYGPGNCFGDTNPSGSFTMGIQTFGGGATAGSQKASNVCAIIAVGGPRAGAAYLAAMDPNAHRALVAAGIVVTPAQVRAKERAASKAEAKGVVPAVREVTRCPEGSSWDGRGCYVPNLRKWKERNQ